MNVSFLERAGFVLSVAALAFFYGFASYAWDWFPKSYLQRAWKQGSTVVQTHQGIGPRTYDRTGARMEKPDAYQPATTLITSSWWTDGSWINGLRLIDRDGTVLHEWLVPGESLFQDDYSYQGRDPSLADIHGSYLLPNGDVIVNLTYVGTARLNSCGEIVWSLENGGHHSVSRSPDGSFWISGVSREKKTHSPQHPDGFPGLEEPVWVDRLLHVSEDGTVRKSMSVLDILYGNDLERYVAKYTSWDADVTHLNDVEELSRQRADEFELFEAGDLVVSLHHINLVMVVDPETQEVKWHSDDHFIAQHDPDFLPDGWIGIFDNNMDASTGTMLGGTRIVALQPRTDSSRILFDPAHLDRFYTPIRGKWQMLDNGNMLLTEAEAGRVVEVAPSGQLVWEWVHPGHRDEVPSITKSSRHELTRSDVASWKCSTVNGGN